MFHLAAWGQSVAPTGVLQAINAIREEMYFTNGADFRVPSGLNRIIGEAALCAAATQRAQVQSPTLRIVANLDVEPLVSGAVVFGTPPEEIFHPEAPSPVTADEALNVAIQATVGAAAQHYGLVWLADAIPAPVTGDMVQLAATATITQVTTGWTNGNLAFAQTLPAGRYAVVGMRARSTDAVAMRLVFPEQAARPGVACVNAIADQDPYWTRVGRMGSWGEFPHTNPPTLDVLGGAAAAQTVILDLIRVR